MPGYYAIIAVLVLVIVVSIFLELLFNPFVWILIAILFVMSCIRRYLYQKQLEEFNEEFRKETEEKKKAYQSRQEYQSGSDDIIDVDYKEFDDDKGN